MKKISKVKRDFLMVSILLLVVIFIVFNSFVLNYLLSSSIPKVEKIENVYKNVVFLGDSITECFDLKIFDTDYIVINSGYSGNTSEDILRNLDKRALQYKPSKIFLLIGTNDIGFGKSKESTVKNTKKIIDKILESDIDIELYVESIYPVNKEIKKNKVGKRSNKAIKKINNEIEEYCEEKGVTYLDLYTILSDEDGNLISEYTKDGLHLNKDGYEVVKTFLEQYL